MKTEPHHPLDSHPLYRIALDADRKYEGACINAGYKSRWKTPALHKCPQSVQDAYHAKITADSEWLAFLRSGNSTTPPILSHV